ARIANREAGKQKCMCIERDTTDFQPGQRDSVTSQSEQSQNKTRCKKEPTRATDEKEAESTPAITNGSQVRHLRPASIGMQGDWNLSDARSMQTGFDDHLRSEFHSFALKIQSIV